MKAQHRYRRGTSLTEVLVALVVLAIGLTSVIALFPVGMSRVRSAVLDTRTTMMARNALDTFQLKRMHNDEAIVNWVAYDQDVLGGQSNPGRRLDGNSFANVPLTPTALPGPWYTMLASGNRVIDVSQATAPDDGTVSNPSPGYDLSYPVLLDPWLYDQLALQLLNVSNNLFTAGVPRLGIDTALINPNTGLSIPGISYLAYAPPSPYCDIAVVTLSEINNMFPPYAQWEFDRQMAKARWFASLGDVQFRDDNPGQVFNPSGQDLLGTSPGQPLQPVNYFEAAGRTNPSAPVDQSNPVHATSSRSYEFTWAAMMQRRLVEDSEAFASGNPQAGRPNPLNRDFSGKLALMCFYRRNLNQPYTVIEGCFYNGSRKVTLSWDPSRPVAEINPGTWLCEMSVARDTQGGPETINSCNRVSGQYSPIDGPNIKRHYRRAFAFYRVVETTGPAEVFTDSLTGLTRVYQEVMVDRIARNYPLSWVDPMSGVGGGHDLRPRDLYAVPRWPILDPNAIAGSTAAPNFDDETNFSQSGGGSAQPVQYYPVVIFDGLREVFEYEY